MDQNNFAYTAYFILFHASGVQVSFGVAANDPAEHRQRLDGYLADLMTDGYTVQAPGLEPGEEIESIDAYVRGETSKGDPCLYLYSANHGLQWRIATVYVERFDDMPFAVSEAQTWPGDAAPARDSAAQKGYLVSVPPFEIVLEPTGKQTEAGRPILRFARVRADCSNRATSPRSAQNPSPTLPVHREGATAEDNPFDGPTEPELERRRKRLHALGTELYGAEWDDVRRRNVGRLTGGRTESSSDLSLMEVNRLIAGMKKLERQRTPTTGRTAAAVGR